MQLSQQVLPHIDHQTISVPPENAFQLPERILQFGTGVLLRGLCDYYVDSANRRGAFNGRIVVVKSTAAGTVDEFEKQDNLYTICVRGLSGGKMVKENIISSAISRVLPASTRWQDILNLARKPKLNIIISNTTEVGLRLTRESIFQHPPESYPAKLLAFLFERFKNLRNAKHPVVVIPTELITQNGRKLREMIEELAIYNKLETDFMDWLNASVYFCNSLVDRIVTKDPGKKIIEELQAELGYEDDLLTMCEDYSLWAIEGDETVKDQLSFASDGGGAFVKEDIELFRSLKLHLLNGTHSFSAPLAFLCGFTTVREAMNHPKFRRYVEELMLTEISPAIPYEIALEERNAFGKKVLDRFSNPFLDHQWINITLQQTTKMKMRNIPVLREYSERKLNPPHCMATGFAAYILFMKPTRVENDIYYGNCKGREYRITDDHAGYFYDLWSSVTEPLKIVEQVFENISLWDFDITSVSGFKEAVATKLDIMMSNDVVYSLDSTIETA
jgi:tagaturonate reductase